MSVEIHGKRREGGDGKPPLTVAFENASPEDVKKLACLLRFNLSESSAVARRLGLPEGGSEHNTIEDAMLNSTLEAICTMNSLDASLRFRRG